MNKTQTNDVGIPEAFWEMLLHTNKCNQCFVSCINIHPWNWIYEIPNQRNWSNLTPVAFPPCQPVPKQWGSSALEGRGFHTYDRVILAWLRRAFLVCLQEGSTWMPGSEVHLKKPTAEGGLENPCKANIHSLAKTWSPLANSTAYTWEFAHIGSNM